MDIKERMKKFNKRWSIISTDSYEESFKKFKTRILNIFDDIDNHLSKESIKLFCQYYGITEEWESAMYGDHEWSTNVIDRLRSETQEKEFYRLIEVIFSLDINSTLGYRGAGYTYSKDILFRDVCAAVELSDVNVVITAVKGEVILYPKGEEELDDKLVDYPLSFLNEKSGEHLIQALQFYQTKKPIKSAESLRRCLEEFLRYKLKNTKGLEANLSDLQKQLKTDGRDSQIRKIIFQSTSFLDQYFNENSKHNDGDIDEEENEFLIYQIGLLMRYIEKSIKE